MEWQLLALRILANVLVLILLATSAYAVVLVVQRSSAPDANANWWRQNEVTLVVTAIGLLFPKLFDWIGMMEKRHPRQHLRWQLARILVLNLVNLYTLILALFGKVELMTEELATLKANLTTTTTVTGLPIDLSPEPWKPVMECENITVDCGYFTTTGRPAWRTSTAAFETSTAGWPEDGEEGWPGTNSRNDSFMDALNATDEGREATEYDRYDRYDRQNWTEYLNENLTEYAHANWTEYALPNLTEYVYPKWANTVEAEVLVTGSSLLGPATEEASTRYSPTNEDGITKERPKTFLEMQAEERLALDRLGKRTRSSSPREEKVAEGEEGEEGEGTSTTDAGGDGCVITFCSEVTTEATRTTDFRTERLTGEEEARLRYLCWETMFGQELVKITVMDLVLTGGAVFITDFIRAVFVRVMNRCWCWDLEKRWPAYPDFDVAENVLHVVNNQGMVWMGMFFCPGLPGINVLKLILLMYTRSWAVVTCNVPHEIVFRASRSNNFYYGLLLLFLFLCTLPVGYAVVRLPPSWHCGPFSGYARVYHIFTRSLKAAVPESVQLGLDYVASPGVVIPLVVLLVLVIYYLVSLTAALRESNGDLKIQLRRERTEERRKMFKMADHKRGGGDMRSKWDEYILPALRQRSSEGSSTAQPESVSQIDKEKRALELVRKKMRQRKERLEKQKEKKMVSKVPLIKISHEDELTNP
ncbi:unnamed protein product [Darwinula stevensoni]|uniref:TMC domain-containing protein n=1 Tax=Darwinula stevensoni TaxID=69355 RepID=A0A7R8X135_9CRUS|nr:unnamed protein product [Darwinula stevensoni]CAG0882363.1 unnamed protein product [Darwinula stevensoni]